MSYVPLPERLISTERYSKGLFKALFQISRQEFGPFPIGSDSCGNALPMSPFPFITTTAHRYHPFIL
ncbi:MAG: hypothetical protein D6826_01580 [Alphaproteobacteria bacterium]|nr:MAG: hypothetical protein D6826_01580 [Alphaproteobacteria bacterium]